MNVNGSVNRSRVPLGARPIRQLRCAPCLRGGRLKEATYAECIEEPPITPMSTDTRATEAEQSVFI